MDSKVPSGDVVGISQELKRGALVNDRFEILGRVASGGMGVVYRAYDKQLPGEPVALKVLHPQYCENPTVFKRFLNEVKVARTLSHPNIVRLYDIGSTSDGIHYISMEYVDGTSLSRYLSTLYGESKQLVHSKEQLTSLLSIYSKVLESIAYAHSKGVIHRDLKPANVLISKEGEVKVADFGTARILGATSTITLEGQSNLGTPQYMSPEQVRGEELDASCDIYALGVIGYELVVGTPPFHNIPPLSVIYKQLNDPIPAFASKELGIPLWFQEFVFTATAKRKEDRFPTVLAMLRELHTNASKETLALKDALSSNLTLTELPVVVKENKNVRLLTGLTLLSLMAALYFSMDKASPREEFVSLIPIVPTIGSINRSISESPEKPAETGKRESVQTAVLPSREEREPPPVETPVEVPTSPPQVNTERVIRPERVPPSFIDGREIFSGRLINKSGKGDEFKLSIEISNDTISGNGEIGSIGKVKVSGEKRGTAYRFSAVSQKGNILFSGNLRGDSHLRGTFINSSSGARGQFEARKM